MIYLELALTFLRIGLFSFGGGVAMIPMFLTEIEKHDWMTQSEFMNIVAVSEMTPGPIAINMATYVGSHVAGWPGAVVSTVALSTPSILVILALATLLTRLKSNPWKEAVIFGVKSAAMALIFYAGWLILSNTVHQSDSTVQTVKGMILVAICFLFRIYLPRVQPAFLIIASAIVGVFLF
ncbi:chromate transporter [Sansalvadorimonas sp. 2012CJ34-2]|uniref:Chromate transporter n=1 Tax=Parendozoicomonas callyspongiae TaxID=2942213 RepID=A0ABT0PJL0_9GAMM|nr:chromate transporter [Sansalvadorimonas sp. 2012CJ34-2]MCL6271569.1 chromate transporter [Sansalvadorimonas sp. 2012CJ34-2]